jgi:hypothetical protein
MTDPAQVIHVIRIGTGTDAHPEGYATDSGYERKILNLIDKYNLRQYDTPAKPDDGGQDRTEPQEEPKVMYRVQVEADKLIGAAQHTMDKIYERTGHKCFMEREDGWYKVYCGSFENLENAEKRRAEIIEAFRFSMLYQSTFVKEITI